ncbi:MAG: hypothetical protein UDG86_07430 [Lachnospiraceae bacterium]|jgi:chromosome segregation ATPase|nr:hypothetical protein [Lachnospiraceae bacterium]
MDQEGLLKAIGGLLEEKLEPINECLNMIECRMTSIEGKMDSLENDVVSLEGKVVSLEGKVDSLESNVVSIELTLENETNRNIKIIAEGHLDLSRKLNEAIHIASDIKSRQEIQDIYLNQYESKLKSII